MSSEDNSLHQSNCEEIKIKTFIEMLKCCTQTAQSTNYASRIEY